MRSVPDSSESSPAGDRAALGRVLFILSLGAIAFLTLVPSHGAASAALTPISCLVCGDFGAVDVVLNTALFLPFGLSLGLLRVPRGRLMLAALLVTVGIEMLQLTLIPGRDASLSDVITNTAGGALGAWWAMHWRRFVIPSPRTARALFGAILLGWVLARLATSWLLRPSFPDTRWYGQVAPRDVYPSDFRGTVLRGDLGEVPARSGEMPDLRAALSGPEVRVHAVVAGAKPTAGLASVLGVLDEHRSEVLLLGQERDAARLRFRLRAADLRLRTPSLRLDRAMVDDSGGTTELEGRLSPGALTLRSTSATSSASDTLPLRPGLGWALLLPFDVALTPSSAVAGTAVCTALAVLIIGLFAGRAEPDRPLIAVGASIVAAVVGLWLPLLVFPEATVAATEVAAAMVGAASGAGLGVALSSGWPPFG